MYLVSRFEVFQDIWRSNKEIVVYAEVLPCLVTSWPQIMQIRIGATKRSRSDLVLDADHALDCASYLVLQASISFCSVSDQSAALLFFLCSHENAVAHINCWWPNMWFSTFASFCMISTEQTFRCNIKTPTYKLPRGAIYRPPSVQLISKPL